MTGDEIRKQLLGKTLMLKDLASGKVYEGKLLKSGKRVLKEADVTKEQVAEAAFHGGGGLLMGEAGYEIKNNTIVSTDGLRTIKSNLYRKGDRIVAARDVDGGAVNFELSFK